jgi:hypothetical protein
MLSRGFEALEEIARVPETEPETVGVKMTLNVRLCPASRLAGSDKPLVENAALDMAACEIVTLVVPVLFSVSLKVWELPGGRLPKTRLAGEAAIEPAAEIPDPDNARLAVVVIEEACSHLWCFDDCIEAMIDTEPLSEPTVGGVKVTFRPALCPGVRVKG